ncbi:MAG: NrdH-redoxin [Anaerolineae bacterium UTCFX2]|nr:glutaredoxin family protein [Anaerolineae bacterium]OQY89295.1 MAG: NrdH-redoxin [Anaerolineae bacterium UTCFX2]
MAEELIIVYVTDWCGACHRALKIFKQKNIPYKSINIDRDRAGEEFILKVNQGMRSVPTIVFPDGKTLVEPSDQTLEALLS